MPNIIKAGFGKAVIAFEPTDFPIREFTAKLDDLFVRTILIQSEDKFALVSFDLTSLRPQAIEQLKAMVAAQTGIPITNIWMTVTHTFSAPHLPSKTDTVEQKQAYDTLWNKLTVSLQASCEAAQTDCQPVEIASTMVDCPLNVNRNVETAAGWWLGRDLTGYADHRLRVLAFKKANGALNLLINYDIQQSVLDHIADDRGERLISSDMIGNAIKSYEDSKQVAIFLPGAAGDQRPLFKGSNDEPWLVAKAKMTSQAQVVAEGLQRATKQLTNWQPLTRVHCCEQPFNAPTQVQQLTTFELQPTHHFVSIPTGKTIPLSVMGLVLNRQVIMGTQPELNSQFADKCRVALHVDDTAMVVTLVNGAAKYLPEAQDFQKMTYQAMNTPLALGTDQLLLSVCQQLSQNINLEDEAPC